MKKALLGALIITSTTVLYTLLSLGWLIYLRVIFGDGGISPHEIVEHYIPGGSNTMIEIWFFLLKVTSISWVVFSSFFLMYVYKRRGVKGVGIVSTTFLAFLFSLLMALLALASTGYRTEYPLEYHCQTHNPPDGFLENTRVEGTWIWWPPGIHCTYKIDDRIIYREPGYEPVRLGLISLSLGITGIFLFRKAFRVTRNKKVDDQ